MFRNYLKTAIRNVYRNKFYSFINILGLSVGLAAFIIIGLWVKDELSYDTHFKNADRIYRLANDLVTKGEPDPMACAEPRIADQLRKDHPQVESVVRILNIPTLMNYKEKDVFAENTFYADTTFFDVFDYAFVKGDPMTCLDPKDAVVLTETMATKIFGNEDPIGKTLLIGNSKTRDTLRPRMVTAIIKDHTHRSHFTPEVILSKFRPREMFEYIYILLRKDYTAERFKKEVWPPIFKHWKEDYAPDNQYVNLNLQPLTGIHLDSDLTYEIEPNGNRLHVLVFSIIGIFILSIAVINYMNLATARSYNRSREVGVRKVIGGLRRQLIIQFLVEAVSLTVLALILALAFVEIILPFFNRFAEKDLSLNLVDPPTIVFIVLMALITGLISGSYPAFLLSSFTPVKALRSSPENTKSRPTIRKALVVLQFSLSIITIVATIVVFRQLDFAKSSDLGFNQDQVLLVELNDPQMQKKADVLKTELLKNPAISKVSCSRNIPGKEMNHIYFKFEKPGGMEPSLITTMFVDYDYLDLMDIKVKEGKGFDQGMLTSIDSTLFIIANESAVKSLGWAEKPLGKAVHSSSIYAVRKGECIGVVKDFHIASLHETIPPMLFCLSKRGFNWISIKTNGKNLSKVIGEVEQIYKQFGTGYPFTYSFLDESFNKQYQEEEKRSVLFTWFSGICIFVSCLGLIGLASYSIKQRTKEIGVRKISGAGVADIVILFSKDFVQLVVIALVIALPVAGYLMNKWLNNFAYHTSIGWVVYASAGFIALTIALLTISFHTFRAANQDLAGVLKHE